MAYKKAPAVAGSLLVSRAEARSLLGLGVGTFDALLRDGEIPVVRYGGRGLRIRRADLVSWIERNAAPWAER